MYLPITPPCYYNRNNDGSAVHGVVRGFGASGLCISIRNYCIRMKSMNKTTKVCGDDVKCTATQVSIVSAKSKWAVDSD